LLAALARVLDYSPTPQVPHHARVAVLSARIASHLRGMDRLDTFYAGLVHDIGLLSDVRNAERWFNPECQANQPVLRAHPLVGAQIVAEVPELYTLAPIILDHHECVNGHGYPRGKTRDEICPAAQVIHFANTCDVILREQTAPELIALVDAVRRRTRDEVATAVADAGVEVLGEPGLYAQLLGAEDVALLVDSTLHRLAADDWTANESEVTALLELFAHVTDAYAADKVGHSRRVASLAVLVAMAMGLPPQQTTRIKWAALVHDVGMVTVPRELLDKPHLLTSDELAHVRRYAIATEQFIGPILDLEDVATIAAAHGEAFDGSGYPHGLAGQEIPFGARILAVCNTFDALTSHRPYREARDAALSIDILVRGSGSLFDPDVVTTAIPLLLVAQSAHQVQATAAM
jgi:HD-GYP domain-containing protein (c-di-GMP phosphodiesterase class II)